MDSGAAKPFYNSAYARKARKGRAQGVCTFIRKGITFIPLDPPHNGSTALETCATEVVLGKPGREILHRAGLTSPVDPLPEEGDQRIHAGKKHLLAQQLPYEGAQE
ncbi:hypothetical protein HPB48_021663 [Haemaphysalis longicornis]|uniref:Uncharacterized protein n=1 Tax=Haemaphysalis longicornis TaxID=44386 RepID=A0A9J6FAU5_HAELO|nr:hypothetical protein HPB48_021663 [Haemaphysalis longicornis]